MAEEPDEIALRAASDPSTPGETLADLAFDHPELRPAVALNPSTYEGLLQWLRELGDPEIDAALTARAGDITNVSEMKMIRVEPLPSGLPEPPTTFTANSPEARTRATEPASTPWPAAGRKSGLPAFMARRSVIVLALVVVVSLIIGIVVVSIRLASLDAQAKAETKAQSDTAKKPHAQNKSTPSASPSPAPTPVALPGAGFTADSPSIYLGVSTDDLDLKSPSTNIHCGLDLPSHSGGFSVGCLLLDHTYTPPASTAGCTRFGVGFVIDPNGTAHGKCMDLAFAIDDTTVPILPYGHSLTYDGYIFLSESTGMTVVDIRTGHGFRVTRSSYSLF